MKIAAGVRVIETLFFNPLRFSIEYIAWTHVWFSWDAIWNAEFNSTFLVPFTSLSRYFTTWDQQVMVRGCRPNLPSTAKLLAYLLILSDFWQKFKWKAPILGKALSSYGKNIWYGPLCRRIFSASWMQFKLIRIGHDFVAHIFPTLFALGNPMLYPQLAVKARVTVFLVSLFSGCSIR